MLRRQKFVVKNTERLKMKPVYALKHFDSVVNCSSLVPSSGKELSKMKFGDCNIRMIVYKVCDPLEALRLDGFEHCSVEWLQGVCRVRKQT